jgi:dipeptidyl aminopeptidase/acylaminoacyl peptidase
MSRDGENIFYIKNMYTFSNNMYQFSVKTKAEIAHTFEFKIRNYFVLDKSNLLVQLIHDSNESFVKYNITTMQSETINLFKFKRSKIYAIHENAEEFAAIILNEENSASLYKIKLNGEYEKYEDATGFRKLFFDSKLKLIAAEKGNNTNGKDLFFYKNSRWKTLKSYPGNVDMIIGGVNNILSISNDGKSLYYSDNSSSDITQLKKFDIPSESSKTLYKNLIADILPTSFTRNLNGDITSFVSYYSKPHRYFLDENFKNKFITLNEKLKEIHVLGSSFDKRYFLVEDMNGGANKYYHFDIVRNELNYLFSDFPAFEKYPKNIRINHSVRSFDGLQLPVNIYFKEEFDKDKNGIPDKPLPTILYIHGGPWIAWQNNNWLITRHLQLLANRGYAVIFSEFRGASAYGKNFIDKSNHEWGDAMLKDNVSVVRYAIDKKIAKEGKIAVFGWSYGGYATMAALTFAPKYFNCGLALFGISDLNSFLQTDFANNDNWKKRVFDISNEDEKKAAFNQSPINFTTKIKSELLLSTGGKDRRIEEGQSKKMYEKLKNEKKAVSFLLYPNEYHDYPNKGTWEHFWTYAERFLHLKLGGDYEKKIYNYDDSFTINESDQSIMRNKFNQIIKNSNK